VHGHPHRPGRARPGAQHRRLTPASAAADATPRRRRGMPERPAGRQVRALPGRSLLGTWPDVRVRARSGAGRRDRA
jgi:hypothetical protein